MAVEKRCMYETAMGEQKDEDQEGTIRERVEAWRCQMKGR